MNKIGFIFDLDGVITDTAEYHYLAWKRLADENEIPFTREDNDALRGVSRRDSLLLLLKGKPLSEPEMTDWMERKNIYYRQYLQEITPAAILPGVSNFLNSARNSGIKIGLGSASKNAKDVLAGLNIANLFDAVGDGYSVVNPKPAPDLFVWVAGRIGVTCDQAIVFEDAEAGIDAARRAGMFAVGIGPQDRLSAAHVVFPNFESLRVSDVLASLHT